jgi:NAD(P)H-dependent FMN reductase
VLTICGSLQAASANRAALDAITALLVYGKPTTGSG